jgi:acyl-CoA synthetase (AMP-forming)/AMP-acid ligase II
MALSEETIPALITAAAERFGALTGVIDGDRRLSFTALSLEAEAFGASLVSSGIQPGDRVSIWSFNSAEWIIAALGVWQAGAVLVPLNTRFKGLEAADILARSRAKALVTVTDFLGTDYVTMLRDSGVDLPDLRTVVVARGSAPAGTSGWSSFLALGSPSHRDEVARRRSAVVGDSPSDILFTSGTTGAPKGVVSTHQRTLAVARDWAAMTGLREGDRYLQVNPYFHMFGLKAGILTSLSAGAAMLPEAVFDTEHVLARVAEERVTVLPGSPTLFQSLLDHPDRDRFDLGSLRAATIGAADIPVPLVRRVLDELPYSLLVSGYGLTEAGTATGTGPDDEAETIATTVGRPRPSFEVRIVDRSGSDVEPGDTGEILLRGDSVMLEYLDDPEATAQTLLPGNWLKTGDLGRLRPDGCLQIVGRVKDMFIVGGFNAYPAEIESYLLRHPDLQGAAVIGVPDPRLGEVGMAFVVRRPGAAVSAEEIIEWARGQMANFKVPRRVEFVGDLPVNATGKVAKDVLRAMAG